MSGFNRLLSRRCLLVVVSSEDAQQIEEQVYEIEIQREGTHERELLCLFAAVGTHGKHVLDLLCVVGGQTDEHSNTDVTDDEVHAAASYEEVNDRGDDDAYQTHKRQLAQRGEVALRGVANKRHRAERSSGYQEHLRDDGF